MLKMWGVPYFVWAALCLILAVVWTVYWPADRGTALAGVRFLILRWGHAATWFLLALAALTAAIPAFNGTPLPRYIALGALIVYLAFLFVTVSGGQK